MQTETMILPTSPIATAPTGARWPMQGEWRYEHLHELQDDGRRYEVINGALYVVGAPSYEHQATAGEIFFHLQRFVSQHRLGRVGCAPCAVHLPTGDQLVQPDVVVWSQTTPCFDGCVYRDVPALVVEVMAANSQRHDHLTKFDLYEAAGVAEYWIADLAQYALQVYTLARGEYALAGRYSGDAEVQSVLLPGLAVRAKLLFNL